MSDSGDAEVMRWLSARRSFAVIIPKWATALGKCSDLAQRRTRDRLYSPLPLQSPTYPPTLS